jgi:hypothetical protein
VCSSDLVSLGIAQPAGNTPDTLYIAVQDSSGHKATVTYPDSSILTTNDWTQWSVPLSKFTAAGVKTNSVKKLIIGIGDKTKSAPGGAGLIFIDDIAFGHPAAQ